MVIFYANYVASFSEKSCLLTEMIITHSRNKYKALEEPADEYTYNFTECEEIKYVVDHYTIDVWIREKVY